MDSIKTSDFAYKGMNQSVLAASQETGKMNGSSVTVRNKLQKLFQPARDGVKQFFKNNLKDIAITSYSANLVPAMESLWLYTKSAGELLKPALPSLEQLKHVHIGGYNLWSQAAGYSELFTRLPSMLHSFYPGSAELTRTVIGFCADHLQVLATSLFSVTCSGILESFAQARKIEKQLDSTVTLPHQKQNDPIEDRIRYTEQKIEAYRILSNQKMLSCSDVTSFGISALLGSAMAGPVLGPTAAVASLGTKMAVRGAVKACAYWEVRSLSSQLHKLNSEKQTDA